MSNVFDQELHKLEKLLDKLNKKQKGGDFSGVDAQMTYSTPATVDSITNNPSGGANRGPARTFKLIKINGKETDLDHQAVLYERTKDGKPKKVSVTSVARKIFRQVCRKMGKKNDCKLNFTLVEITRELDNEGHVKPHNERTYNGSVEKKKKPTKRTLPNGKVVVNKYDYKVKHVPMGMA